MLDRKSDQNRAAGDHGGRPPRRRKGMALKALVGLLALGAVGGAAATGLFAGFLIGEYKGDGYGTLRTIDRKLQRTFSEPVLTDRVVGGDVLTHLIRLKLDVGRINTGRTQHSPLSESGGGMTTFGDDVLLLPYDGRIYAATSGSDIRTTAIAGPDNARAAYQALASDPAWEGYQFNAGYLRYNDLLMADTPSGRALLASYTEFHPDEGCTTNSVARLDVPEGVASVDGMSATSADWRVIYRTRPCLPFKKPHFALEGHMAGGKLAFQAPSTLVLTSGDFHWDGMRSDPGPGIAQDPDSEYGKIVAIDTETGAHRVLSMGHRNPQGVVAMPDGRLYVVEHGPRGGDELNLIQEGANYGWPLESYGTTYQGAAPIPGSMSFARHDHFPTPVFAWLPSVAPAGMTRVDSFHPAWDGDLLVGALVDKSLHRLRLAGDRVVYSERIPLGTRVRDVEQAADGRLVLWTDSSELIFVTGESRSSSAELLANFRKSNPMGDAEFGSLSAAVERCSECHSLDAGEDDKAPSLAHVVGAPVAGTTYAGYSDALRAKGGTWTEEDVIAFLDDPEAFAPGTGMPDPAIDDRDALRDLARFLAYVSEAF